ncbi:MULTISPECIES: NAD(P)-binding domain-containing protein [Prauserella salsuginis group]|uniref:NAD(P)-binding domain-containing protein n=1 Tax=Prauserella salsuginis TaxID=387889 RepID=A0ABW6G7K9_9PSEU|nr:MULTISPECIES: NAD(P)-binding domain-containing protein [Prauserella salsuginis group]MCR3719535.1 Pyridine nucleotide-disulfide oxidoreductase [Prauserella flava]MCR3735451.1 Pyridine nucleotide-disulfide oxidoreductase [Prauserella salsuginis]
MNEAPVVVVGAGPVGLAAAAELLERGIEPLVLERGEHAGAAVAEWGHVRLFSRWSELVAPPARRLLAAHGHRLPDDRTYPTGAQWAAEYLRPLATTLGRRVRCGTEVVGLARRGRDRVVDAGRDTEPLTVHVRTADGEERITARAVVDASGTWSTPNPLGGDGLPAVGEGAAAERIARHVPDLSDAQLRARYVGRHVVVAGSGHSALTALIMFDELAAERPDTRVTWVLRRGRFDDAFGGGAADQLPARGALGDRARSAVAAGRIVVEAGFRTDAVERDVHGKLRLTTVDGRGIGDVDEIVALTGFRPDLSWLSEVRLELDTTLQAPVRLAPLIDPNVHSCGTVYPHGAAELAHPEPDVYLAGMKSYGRAPTFPAMTGYEQVRSIAAELAGDTESARRVELTLPETGVCGGSGLFDEQADEPMAEDAGGCCGGTVEIATPAASTSAPS